MMTTTNKLAEQKYPTGRYPWLSWHYRAMRSPLAVKLLFGMKVLSQEELAICFPNLKLPVIYFTLTTVWMRSLIKDKLRQSPNLKLLEIGTGSYAVLSGYLSRWTKETIDATDIEPAFVASAKKHIELNKVNVNVFQSDIFSHVPVGKKYDLIFWNPPTELNPNTYFPRLFKEVPDFLNPDGQLIIVYNNKRLSQKTALGFLVSYESLDLLEIKTWIGNMHEALVITKK